jgi:hypothetical protein
MDQTLPLWNKTARVPLHERFELANALHTHSPNTHKAWKTLWEHSASLGAFWNYKKHEGGRALFIGQESSGRLAKGRTPGGSCPAVPWLPRTSRYYPEGIQKVAYVRWSHVRPLVRFAERTSGGPLSHVRTIDNSVRPPNLAYVCPKVQITPLAALVTQNPN